MIDKERLDLRLLFFSSQEAFMENYFASQRDNIFRNVEVLIYVFDVESRELEKDIHYYQVYALSICFFVKFISLTSLSHSTLSVASRCQRDLIPWFGHRDQQCFQLSAVFVLLGNLCTWFFNF